MIIDGRRPAAVAGRKLSLNIAAMPLAFTAPDRWMFNAPLTWFGEVSGWRPPRAPTDPPRSSAGPGAAGPGDRRAVAGRHHGRFADRPEGGINEFRRHLQLADIVNGRSAVALTDTGLADRDVRAVRVSLTSARSPSRSAVSAGLPRNAPRRPGRFWPPARCARRHDRHLHDRDHRRRGRTSVDLGG